MTLMVDAFRALSKGFHIFPVQPGEKTPHLLYPNKPWTIKWSDVATNYATQVHQWWTQSPTANIGVACKQSGLLVVDCDIAKEPYPLKGTDYEYLHERYGRYIDGADVLREICLEYGQNFDALLDTYTVQTGSLGLHIYFSWPEDVKASQASIVKGVLDIRCNGGTRGGYVLGAGSVTEKGEYVVENDLPVAPAPGWLVELCKEKERPPKRDPLLRQPGTGSFTGLVASVSNADEGNRNAILHWSACCMRDDGEREDRALELLVPAALECGLYEREATATIRSAFRRR